MREGVIRLVGAAALVALVGVAGWWALRSESTPSPPPDDASKVENARAAQERRDEAERRNVLRPPRKQRADDEETKSDSAAGQALVVRVVVKEKGDAVAGARVVVRGENLNVVEATTDKDGAARFEDFHDDYARIEATTPGFTRGRAFAAMSGLRGRTPIVVEVEPGLSVDGVVREETDGRGVAGARVVASGGGGDPFAETTSAADGSFHLDGLPTPAARSAGVSIGATEPRHVAAFVRWRPTDGPRVEIRMAAAGILRGRVLDASGAPAPWATVWATVTEKQVESGGRFAPFNAQSDADGRYELGGLPLGCKWHVVASKPTFVDSAPADDVVLEAGRADAARDFTLLLPARIIVRVRRPDGSAGAGANVRLAMAGVLWIDRTTDARGECDFEVAMLGRCGLYVRDRRFAVADVDVDLASGERREIDVRLESGATLAGVVVDDVGAPIANASVSAHMVHEGPTTRWPLDATTGADGTFRFDGLSPGDVVVDVSRVLGHETLSRVSATAPASDVRIVMRRDGGVTFRLRYPPGASAPNQCNVALIPRGRPNTSSLTIETHAVPWSDDVLRVPAGAGAWTIGIGAVAGLGVTREVDVAPGADTSLGDITIDPGLTVEGRIVDAEGRPVKGAVVTTRDRGGPINPDAMSQSFGHFANVDGTVVDLGRSGAVLGLSSPTGAFRIEHQAPGATTFTVSATDYVSTTVSYEVAAGAPPLVVTLRRGGMLRGTVRDADGNPPAGLNVDVKVDDPGATTPSIYYPTVDRTGAFTGRVRAGRAHLVVRRNETTLATRDVDVREGEETSVEITLER